MFRSLADDVFLNLF